MLFVCGLVALTCYCDTASSVRAIIAVSIVWTLARLAFWVGYHIAPDQRVAGLVGNAQTMLVLLYVAARFANDLRGPAGVVGVLAAFVAMEAAITILVRRH